MNDSNEELQTCIYSSMPHKCDHETEDREYHAQRGEEACGHFPQGPHEPGTHD